MSVKQVIVMRRDLGMRRGKEISQGAHASIAFLTSRLRHRVGNQVINLSGVEEEWINDIFTKVCLRVESEEELLAVHVAAQKAGLQSHLITDAGLTEFHGVPTVTCCAIGPDYEDKINPITGHLKLL